MKSKKGFKSVCLLMLVVVMIFGLCSCSLKKSDESASSTEPVSEKASDVVTQTQPVTEAQTEPVTEVVTQTQQTTQPIPTTQPVPTTQPQTKKEEPTQAVSVSGTRTLTDGSKTVVYPAQLQYAQKRYPVIVWANGTSCPTQLYISLLEALANGGYIVVADSDTMTADGTSQIDSINYILGQNGNPSSVFYNKVDASAVGACGHSQGGRSCVNAAQKDSRIRCIVSIAGASSADEARGLKTPCLFLTGTNDLVVISSQWCKPSYDAVSGRAAYASLKGGIHTTCMTNPEKVSGYTLDWFNGYMLNSPSARQVFQNGGKLANDSAWQDFQNKN